MADQEDDLPTVSVDDANSGDYSATPPQAAPAAPAAPAVISADEANSGDYSATPPAQQVGILGAIPEGIKAGFKSLAGGAAILGGERDITPEAPTQFTGETAQLVHGIFRSIPALISGLAGGTLGTLAEPVGGSLAGGALGYGTVTGIQDLYDEYQTALQKYDGDKDKALSEAMKSASIDAGGGAVSWAALPVKALKVLGPILGHIFTQAGVQGGIGAATQAGKNIARGDDVTEGVLQAGAMNAALTAGLMGAHAGAGAIAGRLKGKPEGPPPAMGQEQTEMEFQYPEYTKQSEMDLQAPPEPMPEKQGELSLRTPQLVEDEQGNLDLQAPPKGEGPQGNLNLQNPQLVPSEQGELLLPQGEVPTHQLELDYTRPDIQTTSPTVGTSSTPASPIGAQRPATTYPKENAAAEAPQLTTGQPPDQAAALQHLRSEEGQAQQAMAQGELPLINRPPFPRPEEQLPLQQPQVQGDLPLAQRPPFPEREPQQTNLPLETQTELPLGQPVPRVEPEPTQLPLQEETQLPLYGTQGLPYHPTPELAARNAATAGPPPATAAAIAASKAPKAGWNIYNTLLGRMFGAANISPAAADMATRIKEAGGMNERRLAILAQNVKSFEKILNNSTEADRVALVKGVDTGDFSNIRPDLRPLAVIMREGEKETRALGEQLSDADKQEWVENHFKHAWEPATEGQPTIENWYAKQGSAATMNKRTIPTYEAGEAAGFKMAQRVKDDPLGFWFENQMSLRAYQTDALVKDNLVRDGVGEWVDRKALTDPQLDKDYSGMTALNGRDGGPAKRGAVLLVPDDMARLYNNTVSKAFSSWPEGQELLGNVQKVSNAMNMWLLAGPLFHGSMTLGESAIAQASLAQSLALSGQFGKAAFEAAKIPIAPIVQYNLGAEINKIWQNPNTGTEAMQKAVNYLTRARASFAKNYDPTMNAYAQRSFWESIETGSLMKEWNAAKQRIVESDGRGKKALQAMNELGGLIGKTLKSIGSPLFENIIPNIKSGVNAQQFLAWMEAHPTATDAQLLKTAQNIAANTDNILGEMRYDNLFWNKSLTNIMQTFILAPSYTAGTLRVLGGGGATLASDVAKSIKAGKPVTRASMGSMDYDPRAGYVLTLPLMVLLTNSIYQYLKTGKGPDDLTDALLGPKTGGKTPDGADERAALPGYWRQVTGTYIDPWTEAYNKLGALPKAAMEIGHNADYRGKVIADPRDIIIKRLFDYATHVAKGNLPIAVQNIARGRLQGSNISSPESLMGIRPANTAIENPGRIEALKAAAARRAVQARDRSDRRLQNLREQ